MTHEITRVVLQRQHLWPGCVVGVMRKAMHKLAAHEGRKRPDLNQQRGGEDLDSWNEIEGACAEYVVAMTILRFWPGDILNREKTIDIPPDIEVRYSIHNSKGHLLLYDDDNPDHKYVFVTGALPEYFIHGWVFGRDGMRKEYFRSLREDRPPCFVVPREILRPIEELRP